MGGNRGTTNNPALAYGAKRKWHWRKTKNSTIHLPVFWLVLLVEFSGTTTQRNRSNRRGQRAGPNPAQGPAGWPESGSSKWHGLRLLPGLWLSDCHFAGTSFPLRPGQLYPRVLLVRKIVAITLPPGVGARAAVMGHRPVSMPPREPCRRAPLNVERHNKQYGTNGTLHTAGTNGTLWR